MGRRGDRLFRSPQDLLILEHGSDWAPPLNGVVEQLEKRWWAGTGIPDVDILLRWGSSCAPTSAHLGLSLA